MKGRPHKTVLSAKDRNLLALLFAGYSPKIIATEQNCKPEAIRNTLHRMYKVLGVTSAPHAIYRAIQLGYISAPKVLPEIAEKKAIRLASLRQLDRQAELEL